VKIRAKYDFALEEEAYLQPFEAAYDKFVNLANRACDEMGDGIQAMMNKFNDVTDFPDKYDQPKMEEALDWMEKKS